MADTEAKLTSTEVVYELVRAKAVGGLTVSGDAGIVVISGSKEDRARARRVLVTKGLHCTSYPERDEWFR